MSQAPPPSAGWPPAANTQAYTGGQAAGWTAPPGSSYPQPAAPPARSSGRAWLAAAAVIVLAAAGAGGTWFFLNRGSHPAASPSVPSSGQPQNSPATQGSGTDGSSSPVSSPSPSPSSAGGGGGAAGQVGLVSIGTAADQPGARHVASFLSRYFEAINTKDYAAYRALYDSVSNPAQSEAGFQQGYRTSRDSGITMVRLVPSSSGGWLATVIFTSHQDPSDSLLGTSCTQWRVHYLLAPAGPAFVIEHLPPDLPPVYQACSA